MKILIDSREKTPLCFRLFDCETEVRGLEVGDYSVAGLEHVAALERKSLPDLVQSLTYERDRFEAELRRSRGYRFFGVAIEGRLMDVCQHNYRSQAKPHAILQSMTAFSVRYRMSWFWCDSASGAAYFVHSALRHVVRELAREHDAIRAADTPDAAA